MTLRVRRTRQAEADLEEIWMHIASDNPDAADRVLERLVTAEDRLGDFPELGQARPDLAENMRYWPMPPYLIFYQVGDDHVLIVRVVHGARDLPRLIDP
ncbi:MAG TPA: type II toxin-antitoxin system RelE/ParE family toxin [Caulobacteraceae bacterium]